MKLFIKQRVFALTQKFDVCTEDKMPVYSCRAKMFSFGKKIDVYDNQKEKVIFIKQRLFHFMPHFDIYINGELWTTIVKKFTLFSHNFYFKSDDWQVTGDFFAHSYNIINNGAVVMMLSKRWLSWGDTYELNVMDPQHALKCLAITLVIDSVCHEGKKH